MENIYCKYKWELGQIYIILNSRGISRVYFEEEKFEQYKRNLISLEYNKYSCAKIINELDEYFTNKRMEFTIPLDISGTPFQKSVWNELINIPYGTTKTYSDIAKNIGKPKAAQAVGQANRVNKIPIFIPCHRVVSKGGGIGGYMGKTEGSAVDIKRFLLEVESHK